MQRGNAMPSRPNIPVHSCTPRLQERHRSLNSLNSQIRYLSSYTNKWKKRNSESAISCYPVSISITKTVTDNTAQCWSGPYENNHTLRRNTLAMYRLSPTQNFEECKNQTIHSSQSIKHKLQTLLNYSTAKHSSTQHHLKSDKTYQAYYSALSHIS